MGQDGEIEQMKFLLTGSFMRDKTASKMNPCSARATPEDWQFENRSEPQEAIGFTSQMSLILKTKVKLTLSAGPN